MSFIQLLLNWYYTHQRPLPWRINKDPYRVWLSEVILQQTRVNQGLAYYDKFVKTFPIVHKLAHAEQQEVLNLWQGLGYYSRARNLHKAAKIVAFEHNGKFPNSFETLKKLPGVGNYTAAAIASICYDEKVPAIDGNAYRVYARYFGLQKDISDSNAWKYYFEYAKQTMPNHSAGDFNQAIMELGAIICTPKQPTCESCPIQQRCVAYETGQTSQLPIKTRKVKVKKRYLHYYFISHQNQFLVQKRTAKDIWQNMYDFPREEHVKPTEKPQLFQKYQPEFKYKIRHILTHRQMFLSFYSLEVSASEFKTIGQNYQIIRPKDIAKYPFPKPIADFLSQQNPTS